MIVCATDGPFLFLLRLCRLHKNKKEATGFFLNPKKRREAPLVSQLLRGVSTKGGGGGERHFMTSVPSSEAVIRPILFGGALHFFFFVNF